MNVSTVLRRAEQQPFQGQGMVTRTVYAESPGRLYFKATYWPARLSNPTAGVVLEPGQTVDVVGREGLTLLIQPVSQSASAPGPFQGLALAPVLAMATS